MGTNVSSISFAEDGHAWVGTNEGLLKIDSYSGAMLTQVPNLPSQRILSLSPNTAHKLWIGTREGLAWLSLSTGLVRTHEGFVVEESRN